MLQRFFPEHALHGPCRAALPASQHEPCETRSLALQLEVPAFLARRFMTYPDLPWKLVHMSRFAGRNKTDRDGINRTSSRCLRSAATTGSRSVTRLAIPPVCGLDHVTVRTLEPLGEPHPDKRDLSLIVLVDDRRQAESRNAQLLL